LRKKTRSDGLMEAAAILTSTWPRRNRGFGISVTCRHCRGSSKDVNKIAFISRGDCNALRGDKSLHVLAGAGDVRGGA